MASKGKGAFRRTDVFPVVVTNRKLSIRSFFVAVVNDADVAASEYRTFLRVVGYRKLC